MGATDDGEAIDNRRNGGDRRRGEGETTRPGPVFDRAMRRLAENDLGAFCDWLEVGLTDPPRLLSGSFAAATLHADLLAQVSPMSLLHAEYIRSPESDMAVRMLGYRAQIMRVHPNMRVSQYAIVLGEGRIRSCDDPGNGFALGLNTIYLRECEPAMFLANPGLAPLAVLAKGSQETRAQSLASAVDLIQSQPGPQQSQLLEAAAVLATIRLDGITIDEIRRESGMTVESIADFYSETEVGQELVNRGLEQGREQGLERSSKMLAALLRDRFGDQPEIPQVTEQLAHWPDPAAAVHAVIRAETLAELLNQTPPSRTD